MDIGNGNNVWKYCVEALYGNPVWMSCLQIVYGNQWAKKYVWKSNMEN